MPLPPSYRIHPAIGIARLGDSPDFFVGPELPGRPVTGAAGPGTIVPDFKDSGGQIKRQAARFRIWRFEDDGRGRYAPVEEVTLDSRNVDWIEWRVHLANGKAAFFAFRGLAGDRTTGVIPPPVRRNAAVTDRATLWMDPGWRAIKGRSTAAVEFRKGTAPRGAREWWPTPAPTPAIEYLGELRTDASGRLLVLGGRGVSSSIPGAAPIATYANNDGWFDDVSDGPVTARIKLKGSAGVQHVVGAWVFCAPPDFAPFTENIVSLYDVLYDMAARDMTLPTDEASYDLPAAGYSTLKALKALNAELKGSGPGVVTLTRYRPRFDEEIWPVLERALESAFLFQPAQPAHGTFGSGNLAALWPKLADNNPANNGTRQLVFRFLHPPGLAGDGTATGQTMPKLLGDDPYATSRAPTGWSKTDHLRLALTPTQYALLKRWADGKFESGSPTPPAAVPAAAISPDGLDRAALERCVGGAFFPGIEVGWQIRNPALYAAPFRINHGAATQYVGERGTIHPGHFSRQMALPWQADFLQCKREGDWGWWPAQRPDFVHPNAAEARRSGTMVPWHRATRAGATVPWATGFVDARGVAHTDTPSYDEMLANWKKFAFIHEGGGVAFEQERPPDVP